tara:strand:+ start:2577 stop:3149 length:573 start_codon:yes stop_codon:yes gene_type:complete
MTYTNFMDAFRGPGGGFGKQSWLRAAQHYSPQQIKVALQQQALYNNASIGWRLREQHMRGVAGMGDPTTGYVNPGNPLGRFQGPGGNLGKKAYEQVKASGMYDLKDIPDLARQSGMFLPGGAQGQWEMDMAAANAEEKIDEDPVNYSTAGSDVGSGASGVLTKKDKRAGKTGSVSDLKRGNMLINKQLNL